MNNSEIAERAAREIVAITASSPYNYKVLAPIVERAIAESQAPQPPHVTMKMLTDAGLNAFGLQLFCESFANICGRPTDLQTPFSFIFRGLKFTTERVEGEEIDTRHH